MSLKIKEEALQNELQIMRLALLKNTTCSCSCNGVSKLGATNTDDVVSRFVSMGCFKKSKYFPF